MAGGLLSYGLSLLKLFTPSSEANMLYDAHFIQRYDNPKPIELRVDSQTSNEQDAYKDTKDKKIFVNLSHIFEILESGKAGIDTETGEGESKKFGKKFTYHKGRGDFDDPSTWFFRSDMQLDDDEQMEELIILMSGNTLYINFLDPESKRLGYMAGGVKSDEQTGEYPTTYYVSLRGMDVEKARDLSTRALAGLQK